MCSADEFAAVGVDPTSNTVCTAATVCDPELQEVAQEATASADAICAERCTPCLNGFAVQTACSAGTDRQCVQVAEPTPVTSPAPAISSVGTDVEITPAQNGAVTIRGTVNADALALGGADVTQWLLALQTETQTLRSASLAKDAAQQRRIAALEAQVGTLANQLERLLQEAERAH